VRVFEFGKELLNVLIFAALRLFEALANSFASVNAGGYIEQQLGVICVKHCFRLIVPPRTTTCLFRCVLKTSLNSNNHSLTVAALLAYGSVGALPEKLPHEES